MATERARGHTHVRVIHTIYWRTRGSVGRSARDWPTERVRGGGVVSLAAPELCACAQIALLSVGMSVRGAEKV